VIVAASNAWLKACSHSVGAAYLRRAAAATAATATARRRRGDGAAPEPTPEEELMVGSVQWLTVRMGQWRQMRAARKATRSERSA